METMDRFVANGVRTARRVVVAVVGSTVLVCGLALLVLPGPAVVVIPVGLGILAVEFEWARRWLRRARRLYASPPTSSESTPDLSGRDEKLPPEDPRPLS
jgi:uncharacterized protein (TIGR02611 family)